ncbi:M23 family peptidase, partial [Luteimonas sp. Y-2-2-4F]|nr:M23 family peptidase [Luteimonas sp. Y-2-2-4F]
GAPPRPGRAGEPVPGTQVQLPGRAAPGATVRGQAPAGSTVEFRGERIEVGDAGRFELRIPADVAGPLPVRIVRPLGTPLTLRIDVRPADEAD